MFVFDSDSVLMKLIMKDFNLDSSLKIPKTN